MNIPHPLAWLPIMAQKRVFVALLIAALGLMAALQTVDAPLKTQAAPMGIVSFELAGERAAAQRIVQSWGETGRVYAALSLGLDYAFIAAYSLAIALGGLLVVRRLALRAGCWAVAGVALGWAQFGAALLDAVENWALVNILLGAPQAAWPVIARWCAVPKFLIIAAGLAYVGVGAALAAAKRARAT